jgi:hypothetical protein
MSLSIRRPRRLLAGVVAGLALVLVPATTMTGASAAVEVAPPTGLRVVTTPTPAPGELTVAWNASTTAEVSEYYVQVESIDYYSDEYVDADEPLTATFEDLIPGAPVLVTVRALAEESYSSEARLRAGTLGEGEVTSFSDTVGITFAYEIAWLASNGVTTGYADGTFRPSAPVLREQMAAFIFRLSGEDDYEAPEFSPFVDVPTTHVFYREISWLAEEGISTGYANGDGTRSFAPSAPVLREQMAAFLFRGFRAEYSHGSEPASFTDTPRTAAFFDEIEWLALVDVTTGYLEPNGTRTFRGGEPVLREQMAAFLYRANSVIFDEDYGIEFSSPQAAPLNAS